MFVIFRQILPLERLASILFVAFCFCVFISFAFFRQRAKFLLCCYVFLCGFVFFSPTTASKVHSINLTFLPLTYYNTIHILQNIVLFVPLGFLSGIVSQKKLFALLCLLGFSVFVEFVQFFIAGRITDINDLFSNTIGAAIGMTLAHFFALLGGKYKWFTKQTELVHVKFPLM